MRLIDADDVMEMLTNIELSCTVIPITEAKLRLRDIPTAYDVDKVVEQLEELKSQVPEELSQLMAYDEAIKIVKAGAKNEN